MSYRASAFVSVALLVFALAVAPSLYAQAVSSGTVVGQVTDQTGAAVAGAGVALTDTTTNALRPTTTNAEGRYIYVNVPPGTYNLTVTQKGFRTAKVANQTVSVGNQLTLNVKLDVGAATETVEVVATTGAELQTLNSTVGTTFNQLSIDSLPSINRDVATFATMQPGMTPDGSVAGAYADQNSFQLDGGQNTNDMDGTMSIYTPSYAGDPTGGVSSPFGIGVPTGVMPTPIDSIEEFKVNSFGQTADFNSSAGSQVSMVTRRGRDAWHGTAYIYYLNDIWNANSFTNDAAMVGIPHYHYSRFGGSVGGPIVTKKILGGKTYFFGNYEGFRFPDAETLIYDTPGPGMRLGLLDFAGTVYNLNPVPTTYPAGSPALDALTPGVTYAPGANNAAGTTTTAACAGAAMGAQTCDPRGLGISPTMQALWALMPQGNYKVAGAYASPGNYADGINVLGFIGNLALPTRSDFAVARIDHDFGEKEHFFSSYRYYRYIPATSDQTLMTATGYTSLEVRPQEPWFVATGLTSNITSNFTNDLHYSYLRNWWLWGNMGDPPQLSGLGAALEPGGDVGGGAQGQDLLPYNVNNQSTRQRYWDGQDNMIRDDMTRLLGNHLLQWGGIYQHNYNQHSRNDNGGFVNEYPTYVLSTGVPNATSNGINMTGYVPAAVTAAGDTEGWNQDYAAVLGILGIDQYVASRSGSQLTLNAPLTPVEDKVDIPYYNVYFTDSWHIKPSITITYGLAWALEMPPYEQDGKQIVIVDQANQPLNISDYLNTRRNDALLGQVYNPEIGFSLVRNVAGGNDKYPFNPYYGEFAPRAAVAWSPNYDSGILGSVLGRNKTVVRGGFSMIYGRLNGVGLVLLPLLGYGFLQPVHCYGPLSTAVTGIPATSPAICAGTNSTFGSNSTPANGFRIGPTGASGNCTVAPCWDGLVAPLAPTATPPNCTTSNICTTLPQPAFPGINSLPSGSVAATDPNFRPDKSYEFDFTLQRQITPKIMVEAGYIGRIIKNEFQPLSPDSVPYMFTLGGQQFQKAYANIVTEYCGGGLGQVKGLAGAGCLGDTGAVTAQPFFEAALNPLGGTPYGYCAGYSSCTAAVVAKEGNAGTQNLSTQNVFSLWEDLDAGPFQAANGGALSGPTMLDNSGQLSAGGFQDNTSLGFANYNALFLTGRFADWHGVTMQSNFTYGKALGTGNLYQAVSEYSADDAFDIGREYGPQFWDRKFVYNMFLVFQPPYYKNQQGVIGHLLGGWTFSPIFTAGSGLPLYIGSETDADFGEGNISTSGNVQAVPIAGCGLSYDTSRHNGVPGSMGIGVVSPYDLNQFANPAAEFNCFRNPILGFDNGDNGGTGNTLRGMPYWNVDMQIRKQTRITERLSFEFQVVFANMFNHNQMEPTSTLALGAPYLWGSLLYQANTPRQFEFGGRLRF